MIKRLGILFIALISLVISINALPTDTSVVANFNFDTNLTDRGHNLFNLGGATLLNTGCFSGSCYSFNGVNDYMTAGASNSYISVGQDYSYNIRFNTALNHARGTMLSDYTGGTQSSQFAFDIFTETNSAIIFKSLRDYIGVEQSDYLFTNGVIYTANVWHTAIFTFDNTLNVGNLYLDGTLVDTLNIGATDEFFESTRTLFLGQHGGNANTGGNIWYNGKLDDFVIWNKVLTPSEITDFTANGFVDVVPLTITILPEFIPAGSTNLAYNTITEPFSILTNEMSTCNSTINSITTPMTTGDSLTHSGLLTLNPPTHLTQQYNILLACSNIGLTSTTSTNLILTQNAFPPLNILSYTPLTGTSFTFDLENTTLSLTTDFNSVCSYTNNGIVTNFTNTGNFSHTSFFDFGVANTSTKIFNLDYNCYSAEIDNSANQITSFSQAQVPINLTINIPQDQQHFSPGTNLIQFYIETNYQAICNYQVLNLNSTPIVNDSAIFQNTNSAQHTTNYSALFPSVRNYPLTFSCQATILGDTINRSIIFFLDEDLVGQLGLAEVTQTLPSVGKDIGGFMGNLAPHLADFVLNLVLVSVIISLFLIIIFQIKRL